MLLFFLGQLGELINARLRHPLGGHTFDIFRQWDHAASAIRVSCEKLSNRVYGSMHRPTVVCYNTVTEVPS